MNATPIRPDVVIEFDAERELIDYFVAQMKGFIEGAGQPPTGIAICLLGKGTDGKFHTRARSWDTREEITQLETCAVAATLLLQRGMEE